MHLACGFMLVRGAAMGAFSAGWSMTALAGDAGMWLGAALFWAGGGVIYLVRREYGTTVNLLADGAICAMVLLSLGGTRDGHILRTAAEGTVLMLAVMAAGKTHTGPRRWVLPVLLPVMLLPLQAGEIALLRMSALCGGLASAGMWGTALEYLRRDDCRQSGAWLIAGASLGLLRM